MNEVRARVRRGSGPATNQARNVAAAMTRTSGTNTSATRSARRWIGAFEPWARWTRSTMRASAVSRPTRVARITNVPVVFWVAPMTSSPGPTATGIGSPVSIDASTADPPSTTTPSTGTRSPGRTRRRSPTATASSATWWSVAVTHDERGRRAEADQAMDRAGRPALGPRLEPAPEQDEADDDRRRIEVGDGLDTGRDDQVRPHGDHDAVGPGSRGADRHERVHVGRPVACRPPGRAVEAAAGPELDERRRDQDQPVEGRHRDSRLRHEHHDHDPGGDRDRGQRSEEQPACGARPLEVVRGELGGKAGRRTGVGLGRPRLARRSRRPRWPR